MIFLLLVSLGKTANAQFLEKLGKKVEERVENTIINKTANKAEKETGNAMDGVLEPKKKNESNSGSKPQQQSQPSQGSSTSSKLNSSYAFSYQYQLTMKTKEGNMIMDYFVEPKKEYLGARMSMSGMEQFMIFENDNIHTFIEMNGMKISQTINPNQFMGNVGEDIDQNDYRVSEIPGKTILGYKCKGMKMENNEYEFKIYYTNDAPFSLNNTLNSNQMVPEKFKNMMNDKTLMMEMQMVDKKNSKNNATMECTAVKENKFNFSTQGYSTF